MSDNGKAFTDRLFGLRKRTASAAHEFDRLCSKLDIEHRLAPPMHRQTNGILERCNRRIEDVLRSHHFRSGEELEATLHRYVWLYNQRATIGPCQQNTLAGYERLLQTQTRVVQETTLLPHGV